MDTVSFQAVEDLDLTSGEHAMLDVLKATLQYPAASAEAKSSKLADDIAFICAQSRSGDVGVPWQVWDLLLDVASCLPVDSPWQECLLQSLGRLRQREGAISEAQPSSFWKDLPEFSSVVREKMDSIEPTFGDGDPPGATERFLNFHSFVARLPSVDIGPWPFYPVWMLREALEEPALHGPVMDSRLQVACVWMRHCGPLVYDRMKSAEKLDDDDKRAYRTGSLWPDKPPLSVERWRHWKTRFAEIAAEASSLELQKATADQIADTLKAMEAVEEAAT